MGFGGPVWHASARAANESVGWALAGRALEGVGDPSLGEWREAGSPGSGVVHIRRRLTDAERRASRGALRVRDIRGSEEERRRLSDLLRDAPYLRGVLDG